MVNEIVPAEKLAERAVAYAAEIAANAPLSLTGNKRVIARAARRRGPPRPRGRGASSSRCARRASARDDFYEGVRAFAEKRPPEWQGR